ncbi:MAG: extracellular solute-binding protein [Clostridia bacterium]|nr:extracellular solute-binding protein [Clostridia bacterium]
MKRKIAILLILVTLVAFFTAACIGLKNKNDNSKLTTVRVWSGQAGSKVVYTKLVDEWNKTVGREKGIYIQYEVFPSTKYWTDAQEAIKNGTTPDIFRISGTKQPYALNGDILPIEDFPGGKEFVENYGEPLMEGKEIYNGKTYYVNGEVTTYALIYNKDLFKKYQIVDKSGNPIVPKTMGEYADTAKKLTHPEDGCYGIGLPLSSSTYAGSLFTSPFDISVPDRIDFDKGTKDYTRYLLAFKWLERIRDDKSAFPGAEKLDNDMMRSQFAAGRIGMFIGASWDVGVLTQQFPTECDWGVAPLPIADGYERVDSVVSITSGFCIGKNALKNDKAKVMEVFKFLHSPKHQKNLYEAGAAIPRVPEIMEDADLSNTPKQWKTFAQQYTEIHPRYDAPVIRVEGITLKDAINYIWSGEKTAQEVVAIYQKEFKKEYEKALREGSYDVEEAKRINAIWENKGKANIDIKSP